jgi:hypothetical protein
VSRAPKKKNTVNKMLMFTLNSTYYVILSILATMSSLWRVLSALLATCFTLVSCSASSSALKMEAICSFESYVDFHRTTRRCIPEDRTLLNHRCENIKSYTVGYLFYVYAIGGVSHIHESIITSSSEKNRGSRIYSKQSVFIRMTADEDNTTAGTSTYRHISTT